MNGDSDGSEYVDNSEHESVGHTRKGHPTKASKDRTKDAGIKREASQGSIVALEDLYNTNGTVKNGDASVQRIQNEVIRSYRDFLNSTIAEVHAPAENDGSHVLPPSQIGISFWSTQEKHKLFAAIQSHGPGDIAALAAAVSTKAEAEIKVYVLLLQEGVQECNANVTQQFGLADMSAAIEVQPESLQAEEVLAAAVELRARAVEEAREIKRWGENRWLIDEAAATAIDERLEDSSIDAAGEDGVKEDLAEDSDGNAGGKDSEGRPLSSEALLNASMFLQLSRSLFMNCKDLEMNWQTISNNAGDDSRPSIRRTAFDDFHNLVVSFTRRLMQASIFQAMSRLRASTDPRLRPNVNGFDVAAARETMGLQSQRPEYWAAAIKRCGIEVYSDSKKWKTEGRQGTKMGFTLSEVELRAELGALIPDAEALENDMCDVENDESDVESISSDAYTETSSSDNSAGEASDGEEAVDAKGRPSRDRRRALSPISFHRAETKYLDRLDNCRAESMVDEYHQALGLPVKTEKRPREPQFPYKQAEPDTRSNDWRTATQYEASWEQPQGVPRQIEFDTMGLVGARRRKRRRLAAGKDDEANNESEDESGVHVNEDDGSDDAANAESSAQESRDPGSDDEEDTKGGAHAEEETGSDSEDE